MAQQERAARTRRALVKAAASEFDRNGYDGTSLSQICKSAGISIGALTFHFSTKSELADAVQSCGQSATRVVVDRVTAHSTPALNLAIDLTLQLARLLETESTVRSAARLTRERPGTAYGWSAAWAPTMHDLLARAHRDGQLHAAASPGTVATLAVYLLVGAEAHTRATCHSARMPGQGAVELLSQIWELTLCGISPDGQA
ncbi:TetR/AcrR family transcriptional regulator [Streptomyces sp. NPDC005408]|uniref:TetR/AcrR family transcriptional regulator n=1 Tax=Streptomyces sp. NPDC005408 TaxID=3155341 RepID=UPI0033AA7D4D